jgi:SAM-dependent methyltransferase
VALYDSIGQGYSGWRRQDPRIAASILQALGDSSSVVNVGAGAGSYEPRDRKVVAVDSSTVMLGQRGPHAAPSVCATAMDLPFRDGSFDACLAILTIHHWKDLACGLQELRRAARRMVVVLTFDTSVGGFWLTDYFPEILEVDRRSMPSLLDLHHHLGNVVTIDLPIPHDCTDGFLGAYWRRPYEYLSLDVLSAISVFSMIGDLEHGLASLRSDLESGAWQRQYGHILQQTELDLGYRLVIARC